MRLTTFSDYTLRVLMYLALEPGRRATIPEIAAAYGISENHLMKVVHRLAQEGLIESVRGRNGGIALAKDSATIRIGEVVRSAEGDAPIVECLASADACRIGRVCMLQSVLEEAIEALYERLDRYTLADLVGRPRPLLAALSANRGRAPR